MLLVNDAISDLIFLFMEKILMKEHLNIFCTIDIEISCDRFTVTCLFCYGRSNIIGKS